MYLIGCVGLALNTLHAMAHPSNPPSGQHAGVTAPALTRKVLGDKGRGGSGSRNARFGRDGVCDPRGKQMIDEALASFDSYPDCPFGDSHPWAMELGVIFHTYTSQYTLPCILLIQSRNRPSQ